MTATLGLTISKTVVVARDPLLELQLTIELLRLRIAYLEAGKAPTASLAREIASAHSIALRRPYTVSRVCRAWSIGRTSIYRASRPPQPNPRTNVSAYSDSEIAERLRKIVAESPFPSERHRKLWARLRRQGIIVSRERVRRIVRDFGIVPSPGQGIRSPQPDCIWGIDSTDLRTTFDGRAYILFAVDHCTSECMAIDVVLEETPAAWIKVIRSGIQYAVRGSQPQLPGLVLRHDNHEVFRSLAFRKPLREIGIRFSRIPLMSPAMNGCAERFVRTLRENLIGLQFFRTLSDLMSAVTSFRLLYNVEWLMERLDYRSPAEIRSEFASRRNTSAKR